MIWPFRRRRRTRPAALLDASRATVERALDALPSSSVADIFVDLASRTGVDLGEVAERVFDRLGELAAQAGDEAAGLADTDTARQLRDLAARAAGRAAELAYRTGTERLLETVPRRRRSHRGLFVMGAAAGVAIAGGLAYLAAQRRAEERRRQAGAIGEAGAQETGVSLTEMPRVAVAKATAPVNNFLDRLRHRFATARSEAKAAQAETERGLWRQYAEDVYHTEVEPPAITPPSYPYGEDGPR